MSINPSNSGKSKLSLFAVASAIAGGLLLWYGWKRRTTKVGRLVSTAGISLLARALKNPALGGLLGPFQGMLEEPIAAAQKLLA